MGEQETTQEVKVELKRRTVFSISGEIITKLYDDGEVVEVKKHPMSLRAAEQYLKDTYPGVSIKRVTREGSNFLAVIEMGATEIGPAGKDAEEPKDKPQKGKRKPKKLDE